MKKKVPRFNILDRATCDDIYNRALDILRNTGVRVPSADLRKRLAKAGATVEESREVVTVAPELVKEAIEGVPSEATLHDLDGNPMRCARGTIGQTVGTYTEAIKWLDGGAGRLRPSSDS